MREALLVAVCLLALPIPAQASEVDCRGYRYGMRIRDIVTLDIENKKSPACEISNKIKWDIKKYCNDDDFCTFRARVVGRNGKRYIIDRVVGPVKD